MYQQTHQSLFLSMAGFCLIPLAIAFASLATHAAEAETAGFHSTVTHNERGTKFIEQAIARGERHIAFEVAENGTRFAFDEAPIDANNFPLYGNPFITQGFIYPPGTLHDEDGDGVFNGVIVEIDPTTGNNIVTPEFPDKVLGIWVCEGKVFAQNGFNIESGTTVFTTQLYDFHEASDDDEVEAGEFGEVSLISTGMELIDVGESIQRAIVGGTGPYGRARGQIKQTFLGVNASEGFSLKFEARVK